MNRQAESSSEEGESSSDEEKAGKKSKKGKQKGAGKKRRPQAHIEYEEDTPSTSKAQQLTF